MALREELRGLVRGPGKRPPTTEAAVVERLSMREAVAAGGVVVVVGSRKGWDCLRPGSAPREGVAGERLRGL